MAITQPTTIQEARDMITQRRQEADKVKQQLLESQKSIPQTTQAQLRGQKAPQGLMGRVAQQQLKSSRERVASEIAKVDKYQEDINVVDTQVTQAEIAQAEYDRQQILLNKVLSGKPIPMGTSAADVKKLNQTIEANPELKKSIERVSTYKIVSYKEAGGYSTKTQDWVFSDDVGVNEAQMNRAGRLGINFKLVEPTEVVTTIPAEPDSIISSSLVKGSNNLNTFNASINNGNINVSSGNASRVGGSKQLLNNIGNFISVNLIGTKEDYEEGKATQVSVPTLGGTVSASQLYSGTTVTPTVTPYTYQQVESMDKISNPVLKYVFNTNTKQGNLLTADLGRLQVDKEQIRNINLNIDTLSKSNIDVKTGMWIGTEDSYNKYQSNIDRLKSYGATVNEQGSIIQPTIKVGAFGLTDNVEKSRVPTSGSLIDTGKALAMTTLAVGGQFGRGVAEELTKGLPEEGFKLSNAQNVTVQQPVLGTMQYNSMGKGLYFKDVNVEIPEQRILTKSSIGNVGEVIGKGAVYFVPFLGNAVFASEVAYAGKESNWNPITFVKENPSEALGLATIGIIKTGQVINKIGKFSLASKYMDEEAGRLVQLEKRPVTNVIDTIQYKPKVSATKTDSMIDLGVTPKAKGNTKETDIFMSEDLVGTSKIALPSNKIRFEITEGGLFGWGKIKISRAEPIVYKGEASISKGIFKESINLPKGIIRKTMLDTKSGLGEVTLFDKEGKILSKRNIKAGGESKFGKPVKNIEKREYDSASNNIMRETTSEITGKSGKKIKGRVTEIPKNEQGAEIVVDEFGNAIKNPNLQNTKVTGLVEVTTSKARNINTGEFSESTQYYAFADIIKSTERKGLVQMKSEAGGLLVKRKQATTIVYGEDKTFDKVVKDVSGGKKRITKITQPTVDRKITELEGEGLTFGFVNPKYSKEVKFAQEAEKTAAKRKIEFAKELKQGKFDETIIAENKKIQDNFIPPSKNKPSIQDVETPKANLPEAKTPFYVGGEGKIEDTISMSQKADGGQSQIMTELELGTTVSVPSPEKFLKGKTIEQGNILAGKFEQVASREVMFKPVVLSKTMQGTEFQVKTTKVQVQTMPLQQSLVQNEVQVKNLQQNKVMLVQNQVLNQFKTMQQLKMKQIQVMKQVQLMKQVQVQQQKQAQRQTQKQTQRQRQTETKITPRIKVPFSFGTSKADKQRASSIGDGFEAVAFKLGKEVSVKTGSKEAVAKGLKDFLGGNLSASGYLKNVRTGEKIRAEDTGLLGSSFRKSKRSSFVVVEEKNVRLRKGTTGKEVQAFRKSKKSKGGFGL
jgi:hypothetical protein